MDYSEFLRSKVVIAPESGFDLEPSEVCQALKPHQQDAVIWACRGGRRALFESFGLGKTAQELEFCRQVVRHEGGQALIVLPLGVRQEFTKDAVNLLDMTAPTYITRQAISCGCMARFRHGYSRTRLYQCYKDMVKRCTNPNIKAYGNYGARGISVCPQWLDDFNCFKDWALSNGYSDELTIDRIDNDGNYEPLNCRWDTMKEQQNNKNRKLAKRVQEVTLNECD